MQSYFQNRPIGFRAGCKGRPAGDYRDFQKRAGYPCAAFTDSVAFARHAGSKNNENEPRRLRRLGDIAVNMDLRETYNKIAEDWHKAHKQNNWWVEGTDKFASFLKPNSLVLDAGCGAGTESKYLIKKGLKIFGIDFSDKLIEIAKREVPSGKFFVMDLNEADRLKERFDGIFIQYLLDIIYQLS